MKNEMRVVQAGTKYQVVDAEGAVVFETIFPLTAERQCATLNALARPFRSDDGLDAERSFRKAEGRFWGDPDSRKRYGR